MKCHCGKGYEVKPLESYAGWYIGTVDDMGLPNCHISQEYYKTAKEAAEALYVRHDFHQRVCAENVFCCGTLGTLTCGLYMNDT